MSTTAFAKPSIEEKASRVLSHCIRSETMSLSESGSLSIGAKIPAYFCEESDFSILSNAAYYPVYDGDQIVGIFKANDAASNSPCYSYSIGFAGKLMNELDSGENKYCLISTDNKLFLYHNGTTTLLQEFNLTPLTNTAREFSDYSEADVLELINASKFSFDFASEQKNSLELDFKRSRSFDDRLLTPWTDYDQGNTQLCWAAAAWQIGEWLNFDGDFPGTTTPSGFAKKLNRTDYSGGTIVEAQTGLKNIYKISTRAFLKSRDGCSISTK